MKRILALTLALVMLLCGCGGKNETVQTEAAPAEQTEAAAETTAATEATTEPTTEPTTAPTEPEIYRNPVNGEILEEPFTGRIFANTISNMSDNLPHVSVNEADIVFEMYVNMDNIVRCLALYSDIENVPAIGSTRSTRPIFNDIAQHYDLVLSHAGGSSTALSDAAERGIDNYNIDTWEVASFGASYRDEEYKRSYENSLFCVGPKIKEYAEAQGTAMTLEKDYGLDFTENGTPENGEDANTISLTFVYKQAKKDTVMVYDAEAGKYVWNQYNQVMTDQITGEQEAFTNVIIMFANVTNNGLYHAADFTGGGVGYYANGGKIIPIVWACDDEDSAFRFMTNDAVDLEIGVGNTYIAVANVDSVVTYTAE